MHKDAAAMAFVDKTASVVQALAIEPEGYFRPMTAEKRDSIVNF